jgi:hypothetical protein
MTRGRWGREWIPAFAGMTTKRGISGKALFSEISL